MGLNVLEFAAKAHLEKIESDKTLLCENIALREIIRYYQDKDPLSGIFKLPSGEIIDKTT